MTTGITRRAAPRCGEPAPPRPASVTAPPAPRKPGCALRTLGCWMASPDNQGSGEAPSEVIPALELDQKQTSVVLAALEDAAALRREVIGYCPDCRSADNHVCTEHEGS